MVNSDDLIGDSHIFFRGAVRNHGAIRDHCQGGESWVCGRMFSHPWQQNGTQCHAHNPFESLGPSVYKALRCTASQPDAGFVFLLMHASKTPLPSWHHSRQCHVNTPKARDMTVKMTTAACLYWNTPRPTPRRTRISPHPAKAPLLADSRKIYFCCSLSTLPPFWCHDSILRAQWNSLVGGRGLWGRDSAVGCSGERDVTCLTTFRPQGCHCYCRYTCP